MDQGHEQTDRELKRLEKKISSEYEKAAESISKKLEEHLRKFKKLDSEYAKKVASGDMKKNAYLRWRESAMMRGKAWKDMREVLVSDMQNANKIAIGLINDSTIDAYALNMNYGTYEIENGTKLNTSFSLYDHATVENLMRDDPQIIPQARLDIPEDKRWNRKKLTSAVTQGILTGESIPDIAKRLGSVADMNASAAIRNARTYTTAAENKGRVDSYVRAQGMGVKLKQEWMATLDLRTRSSHRQLDGEKQEVGKKFSNGCRYPGDPEGKPWEIYNCRCTLVAAIDGFDDSAAKRFSRLPKDMSYEEWKGAHKIPQNGYGYSSIGMQRPVRPRKNNFDTDEEFYVAREAYKRERELYDAKMDDIVGKAASVERFKTKEEIVEWAKRNGVSIDEDAFDKIDLRAFNESSYTIEEMFKRFPEIKGYDFEYFDGTVKRTSFRIGTTSDGLLSANGGVNFNPDYFKDYEYGLRSSFEQQTDGTIIKGDGTFSSLIRHEYGHNVQGYIETKIADKYHMNTDDWRLHYKTFDEFKEAQKKYHEERDRYTKELFVLSGLEGSSEYSRTNTMELFAEGFAEYTSGSKSEFGRSFGEFLKRWY